MVWPEYNQIILTTEKKMPANQVAVEFVRFVLKDQPTDADFLSIYDAMGRAAAGL